MLEVLFSFDLHFPVTDIEGRDVLLLVHTQIRPILARNRHIWPRLEKAYADALIYKFIENIIVMSQKIVK